MVIMRRRDKRRGNEAEEIIVASDPSIVANKGVRSLGGARTGRFAADMRVSVGGYGRADKTWGVDHPWHSTDESNFFFRLCAKDHMEEGAIAHEQVQEEPVLGLSRAQLKKRKSKLKKQGLTAAQAAEKALNEAEEAKQRHEEEKRLKEKQELERREEVRKKRQERKKTQGQTQETKTESTKAVAKKENRNKEKKQTKQKKQEAMEQSEQQTREQELEMQKREVLASAYEENVGSEVTTKSGLVLQDQRIGQGKLPSVGEMLTVKYRGRLGQDGLVFSKGMLTTKYGTGSVIAGWEEGLGTMRPGGIRLLTILPELGYGENGKGDKIPPNATLFFEVELVRVGKRKREIIGEDDIPLPSSFQRKSSKETPGKPNDKIGVDGKMKLSKSQLKRRRRNQNKNRIEMVDAVS